MSANPGLEIHYHIWENPRISKNYLWFIRQ